VEVGVIQTQFCNLKKQHSKTLLQNDKLCEGRNGFPLFNNQNIELHYHCKLPIWALFVVKNLVVVVDVQNIIMINCAHKNFITLQLKL